MIVPRRPNEHKRRLERCSAARGLELAPIGRLGGSQRHKMAISPLETRRPDLLNA